MGGNGTQSIVAVCGDLFVARSFCVIFFFFSRFFLLFVHGACVRMYVYVSVCERESVCYFAVKEYLDSVQVD